MVAALFFLAPLVAVVCAKPITRPTTMVLAGQRTAVPSGFVQEKEGPGANQTLDMLINLAQNNLPGLEKALLAASTPNTPQYGQHLTKDQIQSFVSPTKDTTSLVTSWLSQNGIKAQTLTPAGDWLKFSIPVEKANALLNANYTSFKASTGQTLLRTMSYSIPSNLVGHINAIHPTTAFDVVKLLPSTPVLVSKAKKGGNSKNSTSAGNSTSSASDSSSTSGTSSAASKGGKSKKGKGGKSKDGASAGNSTTSASSASSTNGASSTNSSSSTDSASSSATNGTSSTNGTVSSNSTANIAPNANVDASCDSAVTPTCLQQLYGIPPTPATQQSNVLAVSGFIEQFASKTDLSTFLSQFRPDVTSSFNLQTVDGGINDETNPGTEASLDIQYTIGVATDVTTNFVSVGSDNTDGISGFLDIINQLMADPPGVLSTSYGFDETDIPADIANSLCNAYMQLTAMGTSIIFSSGDGGVGGSTNGETCDGTTFIPTFPSGCPYVTSVGATTGIQETAASFSSGGFSNIFPQPAFQQAAVSGYLSTLGNTNAGDFNATGRGFPDVSAQGENVQIVVNGAVMSVDGTSCSAPIFASVISLINDQRIAANQPPLGFLNPLLYTNPGAFSDITTGDNPGCGTNGFPAAKGWDPITGLGTPIFNNLASLP